MDRSFGERRRDIHCAGGFGRWSKPGVVERRAAIAHRADFGLQLASRLIQVAVDPFDQVDGLRIAVQSNSASVSKIACR